MKVKSRGLHPRSADPEANALAATYTSGQWCYARKASAASVKSAREQSYGLSAIPRPRLHPTPPKSE